MNSENFTGIWLNFWWIPKNPIEFQMFDPEFHVFKMLNGFFDSKSWFLFISLKLQTLNFSIHFIGRKNFKDFQKRVL